MPRIRFLGIQCLFYCSMNFLSLASRKKDREQHVNNDNKKGS